jgi:hypothetical protein
MVKLALVLATGCTVSGLEAAALPPALDRDDFRCNVQPVLAARCAFPACHGSARRPLSLFAVGRMRLGVGWEQPKAPLTADELDANFRVATGFTTTAATGEPWLLAKPLDTAAGGYFHRGKELYGAGDVFASTADPGYQLLADWIAGATADPACQPAMEIGP